MMILWKQVNNKFMNNIMPLLDEAVIEVIRLLFQ